VVTGLILRYVTIAPGGQNQDGSFSAFVHVLFRTYFSVASVLDRIGFIPVLGIDFRVDLANLRSFCVVPCRLQIDSLLPLVVQCHGKVSCLQALPGSREMREMPRD